MIRNVVIYVYLLLIPSFLFSQGITDTTFILNQVDVKAKHTLKDRCIIKTEIDTSLLQESLNSSLSNLLSNHSPVFIKTYGQGALATASFRGTAASHTQVEWNGININSPMLGQVDFSLIPVFFIDELSLFHGGSSLQKSSGALGGSIIINSRPEWSEKFSCELIQSIGSFATYQTFAKVKVGTTKYMFDLRIFHEQSENNFLFYNTANGLWNYENQRNADYNKNGALLNSYFKLGDKNFISFNVWGQLSNRNLPPIMSYQGTGRDEYQNDKELRFNGKWKFYKGIFKSELNTGYSKTKLDYYLANNTPLGLFINFDSKSSTETFSNKYNFEIKPRENTIISGVANINYHKANIYEERSLTGYNKERLETGVSISLHQVVFKKISVYGLLRNEFVDYKFTSFIPSLGIEYDILKKHSVYIKSNFTRNYHQPTLNDLYWLPGGNPNLRPEKGITGDVALDLYLIKNKSFMLETKIAGYVSKIEDWIIWRPGEFRFWQADNIKNVLARGIEYSLNLSKTLGKFKIDIFTNYAYTKTTNQSEILPGDKSVGKQLIYIPVHKANALANVSFYGFLFSYSYAFTGERFTTSSNETTRHTLPGYSMHNITIGKKQKIFKKDIEFQFKINNLLNLDYQAILWRAMPRRNYRVILKIEI